MKWKKAGTEIPSSRGFRHYGTEPKLTLAPSKFLPLHKLKSKFAICASVHEQCAHMYTHIHSSKSSRQFQGTGTPIEA